MTVETMVFYIAMAGTVAFASSAVLAVAEREVDLFAAIVLGTITAIGGGTVRDIILEAPVFWAKEIVYPRSSAPSPQSSNGNLAAKSPLHRRAALLTGDEIG